jgi:hypothetical protein
MIFEACSKLFFGFRSHLQRQQPLCGSPENREVALFDCKQQDSLSNEAYQSKAMADIIKRYV